MPLPRVRFTVRRMMVAVAVVAMALAVTSEILRLRKLGREYRSRAASLARSAYHYRTGLWPTFTGTLQEQPEPQKAAYFKSLAEKYRRAARYPFLTVAPDPPEPE